MSQDNIKSFERESFRAQLSKLAESKAIDDATFADIVYAAMSKFAIHEDMFRDAFGLTKGATDRWTQRRNMPQPSVRAKIALWIRDQI